MTATRTFVHHLPPKGPVVYRCYGDEDSRLYIGSSIDVAARFQWHQKNSQWWPDVRSITFTHCPTEQHALAAERVAIRAERPLHNRYCVGEGRSLSYVFDDELFTDRTMALGLTTDAARAAAVGIDRTTIHRLRGGTHDIRLDLACRMAAMVGVPLDELFKPRPPA